jgi:hypothetical protein
MSRRLTESLPEFARELEDLLKKQERNDLALQVASAVIVERCTCHDDFCASFYLKPQPKGPYPGEHEAFDIDAEQGMVLVDVVNGELAHVEVLNRDDVRKKLDQAWPL